jgi:hypothetical protein
MTAPKKGSRFYQVLFSAIMILFVGILVYVYRQVKGQTIVMLDDKGHPTSEH